MSLDAADRFAADTSVSTDERVPPSAVDLSADQAERGQLARRTARSARRRHKALVYTLRIGLLVAVLGLWQALTASWLDPFFYSRPSLIWDKLATWFTDGTAIGPIWQQISVTLQEAVLGFILGSIAGIVLGILLGRARLLAEVLSPYLQAFNAVPRIVLAALFLVWFGLGMQSKVATAFVLVFFPVFFNAFQGAREVDRNLVDNARVLGAGRLQVLWSIVVPSSTSWILASLHTAFGFALIGAIVGEYAGSTEGLGLLINQSQGLLDSAGIYAGMLLTTVLALGAELVLGLLERRLMRWRPPSSSATTAAV